MTNKSKSKQAAADVAVLLRARNPFLWIVTREEARVERYLFEAALSVRYTPRTWDAAQGFANLDGTVIPNAGKDDGMTDPGNAIDTIAACARGTRFAGKEPGRGVWVMRDLSPWLVPPVGLVTQRQLRNLARLLPTVPGDNAQAIVVITTNPDVPAELANHATVIEWPLPDRGEVAELLDEAIEVLPDDVRANAISNGARETAIDAAIGLTGEEAVACYAKSLVQTKTIDPTVVAREKKRVIARERVLEWYDPLAGGLDAVGGLGNLKSWLTVRAQAYSKQAREYGLPAPKGALLIGVPGCLTGDTLIDVNRGQKACGYKRIRLDALYYRYNDQHGEGAKLGLYEKSKKWDLSKPTRAHSFLEDKGYIGFNDINRVVYSGIKTVYRLVTDHGTRIKATADHEFLTARGYVRLEELSVGDELYAYMEGVLIDDASTGRNINKAVRRINNVGNHPYARRIVTNGLEYTSHALHRLVIEANMNGMRLEEFLWALHGDTTELDFLPGTAEVHHKDRDRDNNTLGNLEVLSKSEHTRLHQLEDGNSSNRYKYAPRLQKVKSITRVGRMPTYDIQMADPYRNFVANGLVVHNCGKSLTAKAISTAWGVPLLKMDLGALKSKFVGESEANMRKAFRVIEAIGRCVVWIDEIEKSLAGATQGAADGGVSSDALGAILNWMQERQGEAFVLATANDANQLPPELMRKGRFDEVWFVDVPTARERVEVLKAAMAAHGRADTRVSFKDVAARCEGFTGAELAALVPDALFAAFADGEREPSTKDLLAAASTVTPMAKGNAKIDALRQWAAGRARPASAPDVAESAPARKTGRVVEV